MSAHIPLADDSFEEEYNKIKEHFSSNLRTFNSQPKQTIADELKRDYEDAKSTVKMIEQGLNSVPQSHRQNYRNKLKRYNQEVENMRQSLAKAESDLYDSSSVLSSGKSTNNSSFVGDYGKQQSQFSASTRKLEEAKKGLYDIEGQSNEIGYQISRQNEQLDGMISANNQIQEDLQFSHSLVNRIKSNITKRKSTLAAVIVCLGIALIIIIGSYFM